MTYINTIFVKEDTIISQLTINSIDVTDQYITDKTKPVLEGTYIVSKGGQFDSIRCDTGAFEIVEVVPDIFKPKELNYEIY